MLWSLLKNIAHVIEYANFQRYRAYSAKVIWENRQMMTNI